MSLFSAIAAVTRGDEEEDEEEDEDEEAGRVSVQSLELCD